MKKSNSLKLLLATVLPGVAAFGVIPVTENFSIRGHIDGAYTSTDDGGTDMEDFELKQADFDLLISTDKIKSEVHVASAGGGTAVEQAFLTLDLGGGLSVTGGKFLSALGFEGDEQYMLYQQSLAYNFGSSAAGDSNYQGLGQNAQQGARATYDMDNLSASLAIVDQAFSSSGTAGDADDFGFEASLSYNAMEGLTVAVGTAQDDEGAAMGVDNLYNIWAQYEGIDNLILAAEYNNYENYEEDAYSWLIMGNYSFGNSLAATLRYSQAEEDMNSAGANYKAEKFTLSPSYQFTENLLGVIEYSTGEYEVAGGAGVDVDFFAVEALFTF
jgi:hypothetical protein